MNYSDILRFHRYRTLVKRVYAAVKVVKAFLVRGVLVLQLLLLAAQIAREPLELRNYLHEISAS